jgi:hypothetical protein
VGLLDLVPGFSWLRAAPWIIAGVGLVTGLGALKSCAGGLAERGAQRQAIQDLQAKLAGEQSCTVGSWCADRAKSAVIDAQAALAAAIAKARAENETRVALAVARYVRGEMEARTLLDNARVELENQKLADAACSRWASERVGCIVRPFDPGGAGADETGSGGAAAPGGAGTPAPVLPGGPARPGG